VITESERLKNAYAAKQAEEERQRLLQYSVDESQKLLERLKTIEAEEKNRKPRETVIIEKTFTTKAYPRRTTHYY